MRFKKPRSIGSKNKSNRRRDAKTSSDNHLPLMPFLARNTPNEPLVFTSGPLASIRRKTKASDSLEAELLDQLGGNEVLQVVESMLRRENSMRDIATVVWMFFAWYSGMTLGLAANALRPNVVPGIEAAIQAYDRLIFEHLARIRTIESYRYMRQQLEQRERSLLTIGIIPIPMIVGNYWTTRLIFMREFGRARAAWVENTALLSAIKILAFCSLAPFAPDFRPTRAHEFIAGVRESADWLLVSEVDVALRREDIGRAQELIIDPDIFNHKNWQPDHLYVYGEILAQQNWKASNTPLHYIPSAVSKAMKSRRIDDCRDEVNARRTGLVRTAACCGEDPYDPLEDVVTSDASFEDEIMVRHDLERMCDSESLPPDLRTVLAAKYNKQKGERLSDTPLLSDWDVRRIAAANQLLKPGEKWGEVLRESESAKYYLGTPPARRYGGLPVTRATAGRGSMTAKQALKSGQECEQASQEQSEFVTRVTQAVFGRRLPRFSKPRFYSEDHAPEQGAASEVRILVKDGKTTAASGRDKLNFVHNPTVESFSKDVRGRSD